MIKAIVGAGGKTTYIRQQAQKYLDQGYRVFVTTSAHMLIEQDTMLTDQAEEIISQLENYRYAMAGQREFEKICALSSDTYEKVCPHADMVLIEADGSKHMPLKYPNDQEPVIYDNVDEIVVICGLHALGREAEQAVHRLELARQNLGSQIGLEDQTVIELVHIQKLVMKGYVEPLREKYPEKNIVIEPIHDGSLYQRAVSRLLKAEMDVSLLKKEWFLPKASLIICGAGHVAGELVKMASCLDFYIKVIDDREEFASGERLMDADEVICDTFDHLENYLEKNAYYVVVTRGHRDDFQCVKTVLSHEYQYLGMIGSRLKVQKTFEQLRGEGFSDAQIGTVYAPIGLDIKAVTPAEIAVSILAQIILEKNKRHISSASRELLGTMEKGTLCIIIEKHGSSPRGVGSMMFVTDTKVIDSIGGGAIEYAVIEDARNCSEVMIREYHLDNEKSKELGMICGGSNRVLFIPYE